MHFRVTVSGALPPLSTDASLSKIHWRVYKWGNKVGKMCVEEPWDKQWVVERHTPLAQVQNGETSYYIEQVEYINTPPPVQVDDIYDEDVLMYKFDDFTILDMKNYHIWYGSKLPVIHGFDLSSCVSIDSDILVEPPRLSLELQLIEPLVQKSHVQQPHQSLPRSQAGRLYPPGRGPIRDVIRESHGKPAHVQRPSPTHASHYRGSGGYVPKRTDEVRTGSDRRLSHLTHSNPTDRVQSRPLHPTVPLSGSRVRRPLFVPE